MLRAPRLRRLWTMLAILSLLLMALLPTLSRVQARPTSPAWMSLCGPASYTVNPIPNQGPPDEPGAPQQAFHQLDHCPFCHLHADALPPAPAVATWLAWAPSDRHPPAAFLHAPSTLHAWVAAQPRAPPEMA